MKKQSKWVLSVLILVIAYVASFTTTYADEIIEFKSPEIDIESSEFKPDGQIPGTNIKIGTMAIGPFPKSFPKVTFEIGDTLYYLDFLKMYKSRGTEKMGLPVYKDIDHGIFKNFLIIRGFEGATGYNAWLFLFKIDKNQIQLIDVLHSEYIDHLGFDFFLDLQEEGKLSGIKRRDKYDDKNVFYPLRDRDANGNPEIKLFFVDLNFDLFIEASQDGLKIDLNPKLYKKLFEESKSKAKKNLQVLRKYLIYGYITGMVDRNEITRSLKKKSKDDYEEVLKIIDSLDKLNKVLHPKEQINLKKIKREGGK